MAPNPAVPASLPLDNLTSQIQQLLGPSFPVPQSGNGFLPNYIRGLPSSLQREEIQYLAGKDALTVPDVVLRDELLKAYVHYVHTNMPVLDLEEFLLAIFKNDGIHCIDLLLFHAVMFAGTSFIDLKYLQAAGYSNRRAAREVFFQRARLLYDFDDEVDRISLVQSLLLMTYWFETPDDHKCAWHWMGVGLSVAHTIGLHRDPSNSGMHLRQQRMRKRIWWSAYTRDRLIALSMRRPMRVTDDDCDVPLTLDDFELHQFRPEIVAMVGNSAILQSADHQRVLALMFIAKSKLCLCISHVLSSQCSVLNYKVGTMETTMALVLRQSAGEPFELRRCDQELEDWLAGLPLDIRHSPLTSFKLSEAEEVLHCHRVLLKMVYLTISSALHLPQVLSATRYPTVDSELQELSRSRVRFAAVEITNIAQDLHGLDLTRYYPITGVAEFLPAVIIHLLDIKSSDQKARMSCLCRFYCCMRILQCLRAIYASADPAMSLLEAMIRNIGIQLIVASQEVQRSAGNFDSTSCMNTWTPRLDFLAEALPSPTYSQPSTPKVNRSLEDNSSFIFASTPPYLEGNENESPKNINYIEKAFAIPRMGSEMSPTGLIGLANDAAPTQNDFNSLINFDNVSAGCIAAEDGLAVPRWNDLSNETIDAYDSGNLSNNMLDFEVECKSMNIGETAPCDDNNWHP